MIHLGRRFCIIFSLSLVHPCKQLMNLYKIGFVFIFQGTIYEKSIK